MTTSKSRVRALSWLAFTGLATLAAVLLSPSANARANSVPNIINHDFEAPPTGANNLEVAYVSTTSSPIDITQIFTGVSDYSGALSTGSFYPGNQAMAPAHGEFADVSGNTVSYGGSMISSIQISGNDTTRVTVTFSGTTFTAGEWTHVGIRGTGSARIADSSWSMDTTEVSGPYGHMPGITFSGTSSNWLIVRVTEYSSSNPSDVIGHEWSEQQASGFSLTGSGVPLYVSYATYLSNTQIPLDALNNDFVDNQGNSYNPQLQQADGSPQLLPAAVPEPATLLMAGTGALALLVFRPGRKKGSG
jgi:hypothetical protein